MYRLRIYAKDSAGAGLVISGLQVLSKHSKRGEYNRTYFSAPRQPDKDLPLRPSATNPRNRKDLRASTLVRLTWENPVLDLLAVLHLNN